MLHDGTVTSEEWAAPGTAPAQPRAAPAGAALSGVVPAAPVVPRRAVPRPLPLRPLSMLEVLDSAFAIVRSRPLLLLGVAAVLQLPVSIVAAFVRRGLFGGDLEDGIHFNTLLLSAAPGDSGGATMFGFLWLALAQFVAAGATGVIVGAWYADRDASDAEVVRWTVRRLPHLLAGWLLVLAAITAGLVALLAGGVVAAVHLVVVAPAMGVERIGPISACRRSMRLVRFRRGAAFGFFVALVLLIATLNMVLFWLPLMLASLVGLPTSVALLAAGGVLAGVVSTSVSAAALVAFYIDLRVRLEGVDLQLLMVDRFTR